MAKIYYDKDAKLEMLKSKRIGIIGYGSQGHAHSQNLRDSGCQVIVAEAKNSDGWKNAKKAGFKVTDAATAAFESDIIVMLVPDTYQPKLYHEAIEQQMSKGKMLMFAHGFSIHFGQIVPPADIDVAMIAPKGPGPLVRQVYTAGGGVPALVAIQQNATGKAKEIALAYAKGLGSTKAGVLETTFEEETETDLFGEQAVLCGGVAALVKAGFETLVEAGYQPEIAYFECFHELKLIVDLMYKGGLTFMRKSVSDTAEYGDYTRGPRVINDLAKDEMHQILAEIQDGSFAKEWILENQAGRPCFNAMKRHDTTHEMEIVGQKLRGMMSWLKS